MALSGMTGFARVEGSHGAWSWAVEARSVNGRNLETRFRGPPGFESLDRAARDGAQARFQRGQLTVNLQAKRAEASATTQVNVEVLERYLKAGAPYVSTGMVAKPTLDGLLSLRGVIDAREEDDGAEDRAEVEAAMAATIAQALDGLKAARLEEGAALDPILTGAVDRIETLTTLAAQEAAGQPAVLNPLKSDDLYFVADGTGGHVFASTYEEHERNVAKWRQVERTKAAAKTPLAGG